MTLDTRQTLHSIFADAADTLHALKMDNAHFRELSERFEVCSKQIYRIETDIEPASDARLEEFKKERLAMLDQIAAMIAAERQQA
jgi:uncharacterized protein YdcH (DUF465 family)